MVSIVGTYPDYNVADISRRAINWPCIGNIHYLFYNTPFLFYNCVLGKTVRTANAIRGTASKRHHSSKPFINNWRIGNVCHKWYRRAISRCFSTGEARRDETRWESREFVWHNFNSVLPKLSWKWSALTSMCEMRIEIFVGVILICIAAYI